MSERNLTAAERLAQQTNPWKNARPRREAILALVERWLDRDYVEDDCGDWCEIDHGERDDLMAITWLLAAHRWAPDHKSWSFHYPRMTAKLSEENPTYWLRAPETDNHIDRVHEGDREAREKARRERRRRIMTGVRAWWDLLERDMRMEDFRLREGDHEE